MRAELPSASPVKIRPFFWQYYQGMVKIDLRSLLT